MKKTLNKNLLITLTLLTLAPLSSQAGQCSLSFDSNRDMVLSAGNQSSLEIEVARTKENLRVLLQICNETYAAIQCRGYTLAKDEWQRQEGDPKPIYVNMGRQRAELTIGALPSWIAQFATKNYNRDQNGTYYSVAACEYNRSRIAVEVAERAHEVIEDKEDVEAARHRRELLDQHDHSSWGPKF
jgi:hypothetical protein